MLKPYQKVNHFEGLHRCLTSKGGILAAMSGCHWVTTAVNAHHFVPRAYDLSRAEEVHAFELDFNWCCAQVVLKRLSGCEGTRGYCRQLSREVVSAAIQLVWSKVGWLGDLVEEDPDCETDDWDLRLEQADVEAVREAARRIAQTGPTELVGGHIDECQGDKRRAKELLAQVQRLWPQAGLDGEHNIWILKPSSASCGRGIGVASDWASILRHIASRGVQTPAGGSSRAAPRYRSLTALQESGCARWVVQRYIERPLLVHGRRKFDIRLWALVTSFDPLVVWLWQKPYIRFCAEDYSLLELSSVWRHLCNHAVTKRHTTNDDAPQMGDDCNMWTFEKLLEHLHESELYDRQDVDGLSAGMETLSLIHI
eukprot:TRINITY_DN44404_c0_g1_i1.p1 TRINITY_DN44404_c0_g1~~TRINITY_DN44404_c0_g1_i1.p1  ORF type:complete len:368 (+),score=74.46 TRINITY_DN44404_c0_g1_i1:230-1333(+)